MAEYKVIRDITEQVHAEEDAWHALLDPDDEDDWDDYMDEDCQEIEIDGFPDHPCTLSRGTYYWSVWRKGMGEIGSAPNLEDAVEEAAAKLRDAKGVPAP